jgi:hypothetical protein
MKRRNILQVLLFAIVGMQVVAFQNCSKNSFTDVSQSASSEKDSGNGGNYDGKISYIVADLQNECGDGSLIRSRIDQVRTAFQMIRENCRDIVPRELDVTAVSVDASKQFITYSGDTFTLVRDPSLQPFSSLSLWNTSVGAGAQWSLVSDGDTQDLQTVGGGINAGQWSVPFYLSKTTDPSKTVTAPNLTSALLNFPLDFHLSAPSNGSKAFVMLDASKRWLYQYTVCRSTSSGFACDYGIKDDTCGDGLGGFDLARGLIRSWEIQQGEIKHVLRFALPTSLNRPTGVAWPAEASDFEGSSMSAGRIVYGSTIGIPANVNLDSLGLTRGGRILAKALQEYGAIQRDSLGSSGGLTFFAEESAESLPAIAEMRADLEKLKPVLRLMRNQSATTISGGGSRRQPTLPTLDPGVCR